MCEMKLGKLVFSHNFLRPGQKKRVVRLNHDVNQLYATLSQPHESKNTCTISLLIAIKHVFFIVCLGERQKLSVKIESRSVASTSGILLLEPQTEGMVIAHNEKVSALLDEGDKEQQQLELDILETGEIALPDLAKNSTLELFVTYEGPYTEFDYRVMYTCFLDISHYTKHNF